MSKEKLLLVGAGGFGRMVAEQAMLQYDCAFVDDGQPVGVEICSIPVVGGLANLAELRKEYSLLVVGIGNNRFRAQVYEKAKAFGYAFPNIVAPSAYISPFAEVGCGCVLMQNACIQNGASVGNGVLLNAGTEVHCDAAVGTTLWFTPTALSAPVRLWATLPASAATAPSAITQLCQMEQIFRTAPQYIKEVIG